VTGLGVLTPPGRTEDDPAVHTQPRGVWRDLLRKPAARVALVLVGSLALLTVLGPLFTMDPNATHYANELAPPSAQHWLGTDHAGRDLLARTVAGARSSLSAALLVTAIAVLLGLVLGTLAGALGGLVDTVLTRLIDMLLGLPSLVLTLAVVGLLGPGFWKLVLAMSVTSWAGLARLARSVAHGSAQRGDVLAARMAGIGNARSICVHVLPAAANQVLVAATVGLGEIILALGGLSFLGLGAQPPTAEWGNMLSTARNTFAYAPWQLIGPGLGLVLSVTAATLLSDALRDATDPGRHT